MAIHELRITDSKGKSAVYYIKGEIEMFYSNPDGSLKEFDSNISGHWHFDGGEEEYFRPLKAEEISRVLQNIEEARMKRLEERLCQGLG